MGHGNTSSKEGKLMVDVVDDEEESLLTGPSNPPMAAHVRDYENFTRMMKYGAIVCLILAIISLLIIHAYWR
jgi:hypothetical protein